MDEKSRKQIVKQYDELVKKYGNEMHALHGDGAKYNKIHQDFKFQFVLDQLDEKDSLLDVGCGIGHLAEYCWGRGGDESYIVRYQYGDGESHKNKIGKEYYLSERHA